MPLSNNAYQIGINYELLQKTMRDKNLTPAMIGSRRGIPEQTVKNIVNGITKNPGVENLAPICEELGIPIEYVLFSHNKEVESKVIKDNPSAYNLKEMYEFQVAILNKAHETEINNIREHYEREVKAHEKEMCNMREHYERELQQKDKYNERYIESLVSNYERRLQDKREHIKTLVEDKTWFKIAAVVGVCAVIILFLLIEYATPGHGWFKDGSHSGTIIAAALIITVITLIVLFINKTNNKINDITDNIKEE